LRITNGGIQKHVELTEGVVRMGGFSYGTQKLKDGEKETEEETAEALGKLI